MYYKPFNLLLSFPQLWAKGIKIQSEEMWWAILVLPFIVFSYIQSI